MDYSFCSIILRLERLIQDRLKGTMKYILGQSCFYYLDKIWCLLFV